MVIILPKSHLYVLILLTSHHFANKQLLTISIIKYSEKPKYYTIKNKRNCMVISYD